MDSVQVRLLREDDLQSAERASAVTFLEANRRSRRVSEPETEPRSASVSKQWIDRIRFFLAVDPGGCWVAADGDDVIGFAISQNRGRVWFLATYGVLPEYQGMGIGKRLMDAVLAHSAGRQGMFISSVHPGATRRYRLAGFSLYPLMWMVGTVDRSTLPVVAGTREGQVSDLEWMDRLDQDLRGAGHGPDHGYMLDTLRLGLAARLDIGQEGYLAVRGMKAPAPYLASGHFL